MADERWPLPWVEVSGDRGGPIAALQYALFRGAVGAFSRLPSAARRGLSSVLGRLARALDRRHTDSARRFVAQAYPALDAASRDRLVLAAWRHLIELALEDARFNGRVLGPDLMSHFEVEISPEARAVLAGGRGGLAVSPHVGMWEALPVIYAALSARPVYVVSRPPRNRPLARFAQRTREARGYRLVPRHGAVEHMLAAVQGGAWVGLMLDQRARGKTVVAPFFGRPAHCERSIPVLARRLKCPLVFAACYRTERPFQYRAVIGPVLHPEELSGSSPEQLAARINAEMERLIRAAPEQYFWLHDRYRKAPATGGE